MISAQVGMSRECIRRPSAPARDYAVVLRPLGTVRVHKWDPDGGVWRN